MNLHFDFTDAATRKSIVSQLGALLDENTWAQVSKAADDACFDKDHYHDIGEVHAAIDALAVGEEVKADMHGVYDVLAQAESQVHGCPVEHTHFHEVGNASGLRNTLLVCLAFDALRPFDGPVTATPVQTGSGKVECAHGLMDIPSPATAAILSTGIPVCEQKLEGELCTPTSAAIIKHFIEEFV
ncbi:MAG: DUF111 family protein [Eggerthellaceae bacterium]|nr:DUF111 family protein [Eggerthellaceae bacterium]